MATKIRPINLHTTVDTHIQGLIDSSFVQARQTAGTDSSSTQAMIDSNFTNMDIDVHMPDNQAITFGNDSDFSIRHDGSQTFLEDKGTGSLIIGGSVVRITAPTSGGSETGIRYIQNQGVELNFNGNTKLETLDSGANVTGNIAANIRSNPKSMSLAHTVDSNSNALLVGPINVDSGVTLTINGTLMVV